MTLACAGGFGLGGLGTFPFGTGYGLAFQGVRVSSLNSVDVAFSEPPRAFDPGDVSDALNPENWRFDALDPPFATLRLVQYVEKLDSVTFRVYADGPFESDARYLVVITGELVSLAGSPLDPDCDAAEFLALGLLASTPVPVGTRRGDLMNPQTPQDALGASPGDLGTLQLDGTGDLASESGISYFRKRIFRRASTAFGGFFHLPAYGFSEGLKTLVTGDLLRRMQSRATTQILQEPDCVSVSVVARASQAQPGIVFLDIRARSNNGETCDLTVPVAIGV